MDVVSGFDWSRPLRPEAKCWIIYGRLGNPNVPSVFAATRANWTFDRSRMRLVDLELALVQTLPDAGIKAYCAQLEVMENRVKAFHPAKQVTLADVSDSLEAREAVWRKSPNAVLIRMATGYSDIWELPFRICGRAGLMSRLQLWLSDGKLVPALTADDSDPNVWTWDRVRQALATTTGKPPRPEDEQEDHLEERIVLALAQGPWWAEGELPSVYADDDSSWRGRKRS
jgi:hypothetical protein